MGSSWRRAHRFLLRLLYFVHRWFRSQVTGVLTLSASKQGKEKMEISRTWVMPSIWTFRMKPVQVLFEKYQVGTGWADPFAGENSPAEFANDIEGRGNQYQMDALEFLKSIADSSVNGVLFDPPYSVEQCLRRYTPKHGGTAGRAEYWAKCKDEIARVVKPSGTVISFCWDSTGIGIKRGFEIVEIVLLCHGACHNDTVITIDRKERRWTR